MIHDSTSVDYQARYITKKILALIILKIKGKSLKQKKKHITFIKITVRNTTDQIYILEDMIKELNEENNTKR